MKKVVVGFPADDSKFKQKALKKAAGIEGVVSVSVDMEDRKLTVIGDVDPVDIALRLKMYRVTELVSVDPAEEEKREKDQPPQNSSNPLVIYPPYPYGIYVANDEEYNQNQACSIF